VKKTLAVIKVLDIATFIAAPLLRP